MTRATKTFHERLPARHRVGQIFHMLCWVATWACLVVLVVLLGSILWKGHSVLSWGFLTHFQSSIAGRAGIKAGLWGSLWLILFTAFFSVPVGVGAAVYLEEYAKSNRLTRFIQLNIANLAGVPSIVYGMLGLTVFVRMFGMFGSAPPQMIPHLPFGRKIISGALTLSILILPVIIIAAQEALRSIPSGLRHASYALGATRWQTIRHQVLPAALPGIMTGVILALSRAAGEAAPLILVGGATYVGFTPGMLDGVGDLLSSPQSLIKVPFSIFTAMPLVIYNWASRPEAEFQRLAAGGIVVLLVVLLLMNASAILIRHKFQKRIRW
jgi:phosphate transport system permease protein